MSWIELRKIKKSYSGSPAVRELNLKIEDRQFVTLLGPSGCGKTTTLRVIAGLEEPDSGEIIVDGKILFSREKGIFVPPEKRKLGLIFQSYALWPHMTVRKNISLALEEMHLAREKIDGIIKEVLEKVQLTEYIDRYPSELSGGQQQRVAVARMIAAEPSIFLMDEPLSNLDAMLRVDMRTELKRLHHELGATTVYVTHDQVEALTLSDRIAVMEKGILKQVGTPEEIYKKPADLFVARFVGSPRINSIEGKLVSESGNYFFKKGDIKRKINKKVESIILDLKVNSLIATIRPEDIDVSQREREGWTKADVYSVLPAGSETILSVKKDEIDLSVKVNGFTDIRMNDTVWIYIDPFKMNYYDPRSGKLILDVGLQRK
ncbi:MAG: ABC transporter ATP-binding protein [Spirochaetes bacterium]|nr:ABC transporter ATP-binding protein [Spirochaetota bacterium]